MIDNLMHFQHFEDLKFLIFSRGSMPLDLPKTLAESPTTKLDGIIPILLENPVSCLDFRRDTASIPI